VDTLQQALIDAVGELRLSAKVYAKANAEPGTHVARCAIVAKEGLAKAEELVEKQGRIGELRQWFRDRVKEERQFHATDYQAARVITAVCYHGVGSPFTLLEREEMEGQPER